ncbi:hypothetical protein ACFL5C_01895, partial [Candidatus Omnitrophota bacterium]
MRRALLIFDEDIDTADLLKKDGIRAIGRVDLFPLTSRWDVIHKVEDIFRFRGGGTEVRSLGSAGLIDREVDVIREKVVKWSADLGNYRVSNRSLKEWFLLPGDEVSAWHFSLLAEKNTLKTDAFFRLAQLQAADKVISGDRYDLCIFSVSGKSFSLAVRMLLERHSVKILSISSSPPEKRSVKGSVKSFMDRPGVFGILLKVLICLSIRISRAVRTRLELGPAEKRIEIPDDPVLFVSYFPAVDKKAAEKGVLKNRYAVPLQEKLFRMKKRVVWIWMYVFIDGNTFGDALKFVDKFTGKGERNFLLDEFMSVGLLFRVLTLWAHQIRVFLKIRKILPEEALYTGLTVPEGRILMSDLMADSFAGWTALEGILFFELYKKVFSLFSSSASCVYYSEMHAWEKALNAAKRLKAPSIKTTGFLHGSGVRNMFHFFYHPNEVLQEGPLFLPLPDVLACNGDIPLDRVADCGYPGARKVESVRWLYINRYLDRLGPSKKKDVLLVAGSIDRKETKALISCFHEAFPEPEGFEVWVKGHPSLPFEVILKEMGDGIAGSGYQIKHGPIDKLLDPARIVIVGSSTVALEALAAGCKVIIPVFSDSMFISLLAGFEKYYLKASSPSELRAAVKRFMEQDGESDFNDTRDFITRFWCL